MTGFGTFYGYVIFDGFVKSPQSRHSRESGNPATLWRGENTGFRVKPGMTDKVNFDFLRVHQI